MFSKIMFKKMKFGRENPKLDQIRQEAGFDLAIATYLINMAINVRISGSRSPTTPQWLDNALAKGATQH